jgi:hypothetical protein
VSKTIRFFDRKSTYVSCHVWLILERTEEQFSQVEKMPRCKSKRNTSYRQRYNALSALEVHTIGKIQHLFTLCILQLKVAEQLFAFFVMLEFDDDEELMMMMLIHVHHCLNVVRFLSLLDNLLMEITPDQVIPRLVLANRNRTFDLFHPGWSYEKTWFCVAQLREMYHLLESPVMFFLS